METEETKETKITKERLRLTEAHRTICDLLVDLLSDKALFIGFDREDRWEQVRPDYVISTNDTFRDELVKLVEQVKTTLEEKIKIRQL
jgi:hypothetical protein